MLLCNVSNLRNNLAHHFCPNKVRGISLTRFTALSLMLRLSHFIMIETRRTGKSANLQFEISDNQFKSLVLHCLPLA